MKLLASIETSQVRLATDRVATEVENSEATQRTPKFLRREHRDLRDNTENSLFRLHMQVC